MAWIESHQSLARHPKMRRLARKLGVSTPTAIGHLHLLWWWALDYAPDGELSGVDTVDIEDAMEWTGEPGVMCRALITTGFVDDDGDGGLWLHDWRPSGIGAQQ